jgi:DNA-binding sugar fermentation-stimulating protein
MLVFQTGKLIKAKIIKRPSSSIKTPYVADIQLVDDDYDVIDNNIYLAHSPSLGCCGLSDKDAIVCVSTNIKTNINPNTKTNYTVELCCFNETKKNKTNIEYVSLKPKNAEYITFSCLQQTLVNNIPKLITLEKEKKFLNSRFDFYGKDINNQEYIFEVKMVPLAYYVDVPKKEYKKHQTYIDSCEFNEKIAYFPDGYRKNANEPVSPRALKHIQELEEITLTTNISCNLIYVVQRTDIIYFQTSNIDLIYKKAVQKAWLNGVQIKVLQIKWNEEGEAYLHSNSLPIHLFDYYGPYILEDL